MPVGAEEGDVVPLRLAGRTRTAVLQGRKRRAAIVAAATTLFAARGYHATTLSEIGAAVGIRRPAVLHHFASKEALLHAVLDEHELRSAPIAGQLAQLHGLPALRGLSAIVRHDLANPEKAALWSMLLAESIGRDTPLHERLQATAMGFRQAVITFLQQADQAGELEKGVDCEAVALEVIAVINGLETSWLLDRRVPLVEATEQYLERLIQQVAK